MHHRKCRDQILNLGCPLLSKSIPVHDRRQRRGKGSRRRSDALYTRLHGRKLYVRIFISTTETEKGRRQSGGWSPSIGGRLSFDFPDSCPHGVGGGPQPNSARVTVGCLSRPVVPASKLSPTVFASAPSDGQRFLARSDGQCRSRPNESGRRGRALLSGSD